MNLRTYRYGEAAGWAGMSIGVARQWPRGLKRTETSQRGYFEVWMPLLAPSQKLVASYKAEKIGFANFAQKYRREMQASAPQQAIRLIAAMSLRRRVNLGCFCENEAVCHRSILRELIQSAAGEVAEARNLSPSNKYFSPACSMEEIED